MKAIKKEKEENEVRWKGRRRVYQEYKAGMQEALTRNRQLGYKKCSSGTRVWDACKQMLIFIMSKLQNPSIENI